MSNKGYRDQLRTLAEQGPSLVAGLDRKLQNAISGLVAEKVFKRSLYKSQVYFRFAEDEVPDGHADLGFGSHTRSAAKAQRQAVAMQQAENSQPVIPPPWERAETIPEPATIVGIQMPSEPMIQIPSSGTLYTLSLSEAKQLYRDLAILFER